VRDLLHPAPPLDRPQGAAHDRPRDDGHHEQHHREDDQQAGPQRPPRGEDVADLHGDDDRDGLGRRACGDRPHPQRARRAEPHPVYEQRLAGERGLQLGRVEQRHEPVGTDRRRDDALTGVDDLHQLGARGRQRLRQASLVHQRRDLLSARHRLAVESAVGRDAQRLVEAQAADEERERDPGEADQQQSGAQPERARPEPGHALSRPAGSRPRAR
jgi:hypothetical protein